jgi:hypothetical protein
MRTCGQVGGGRLAGMTNTGKETRFFIRTKNHRD